MSKPSADRVIDPQHPEPVRLNTLRVIEIGTAIWAVLLVVILIVPALREGNRDWWVWVPVAGLALGGFAWWFVRRGRGNASAA